MCWLGCVYTSQLLIKQTSASITEQQHMLEPLKRSSQQWADGTRRRVDCCLWRTNTMTFLQLNVAWARQLPHSVRVPHLLQNERSDRNPGYQNIRPLDRSLWLVLFNCLDYRWENNRNIVTFCSRLVALNRSTDKILRYWNHYIK